MNGIFFVFEISTPFQWKPGFYASQATIFRVWWLWFALSLHQDRFSDMIKDANKGIVYWENPK